MADDHDLAARAFGEALYASMAFEALVLLLQQKGVLSLAELAPIIDLRLLSLEKWRGEVAGTDVPAIDHARSRLANLLKSGSGAPP